jgi:amino acid adenylation domain-containing protein
VSAQGIEEIYELSPLQQGMLFHTLLEPESKLYFEQVLIPIEGAMNADACEAAWNHVAEDIAVLRTSFHWEQIEKPVQVVHRKARVPFAKVDLRDLDDARRHDELRKLVEDDRQRGFDMTRAPLLRVTLVQWTATSFRLVVSFHHVILDGWSMQHVFGQFTDAYQALGHGKPAPHRRGRPYSDYIRWLQKRDRNSAERYWKKTLDGLEGACLLPPDAEAASGTDAFAEHELELAADTMARLRDFTMRHQLTVNTVLQGAWALLLAQMTGSDDVVFGVTVSGRPAELPDVESMVGLFINTVPMRARVSPEAKVVDWLRMLQQEQFDARQFDHTPLVQIRELSGFAGRGAIFDTLFAFENYPTSAGNAADGPTASFVERTNYALSAVIVPRDRLEVRLLYRTATLSAPGVTRIGERFALIVESLAAASGDRINELPTLTRADRALFASFNDTATPYPSEATVPELLRDAAADAIAIEHGSRTMTYAELELRANALAAELRASGAAPGTFVGLLSDRSCEAVVAMLAVLKSGAAYVPIDPAYPAARIDAILDDTAARIVLASEALASRITRDDVRVLVLCDRVPAHDEAAPVRLRADGAAYVMYTSGSTGKPKGVVVPHRAIVRLVRNTNYIELTPADRVANMSNGAFDAATFEIWGALANGARLVILDRDTVLSPAELTHEIRERHIGVLFLTAALFRQVVEEVPDAFATCRAVFAGGDAVDPRAVRAVLDAGPPQALANAYGPTESTTFATVHLIDKLAPDVTNVPIGRPIANTTAYVLDPALRPVPPGAPGELYLGGDGLAHGYHGRGDLTAERFLPDPFSSRPGARMYRTGDKVRRRPDGAIEFLGRFDHQIKLRGYRIELAEIETRVLEHDAVRQALVTVSDNGAGKRIVAYVVPRDDASPSWKRDLRQSLRKHLPDYMQPAIEVLPALPLNANGKLDRDALPAPGHDRDTDDTFVAPATDTQRKLAAIWQQLLGVDRVGVHDVFFDIGGHSLRATQFVSRVRREFGVELPLRTVFEHPTIADLAPLLETNTATTPLPHAPEIVRVSREKHRVVQ